VTRQPKPGRDANGLFLPGNTECGEGGKAFARNKQLAEHMGLEGLPKAYAAKATGAKRSILREMTLLYGAENVGRTARSFVQTASVQLAWSRFLTDHASPNDTHLMSLATKLGNDSRTCLKEAHAMSLMHRDVRSGRNPAQEATDALAALLGGGEKKGTP